jgi:hypothetical protein
VRGWSSTGRRRAALLAAVPLLLAGPAGCGGSAGAGEAAGEMLSATTVRILVRDINIRAEGADCAGTGAYRYVHHRAPYRVLDTTGVELAAGDLPAGRAVAAFDEDLEVDRIPTYCAFAVDVRVPQRAAYLLEVDGRAPVTLTPDDSEGPALVAVVPS